MSSREVGADRRGALRHAVRMEGMLSGTVAGPLGIEVIDISASGCQIVRPAELGREGALLLSFGGFAPFEAAVVWTSPRAVGLRFAHPLHPALVAQVVSAARGRRTRLSGALVRRAERERVWHFHLDVGIEDAALPAGGRPRLSGVLSDLSPDGCRIHASAPVAPGTGLLIHIADEPTMLGIARWCEDGAIGIEFGAPLPPGMVERIARSGG